MGIYQLEGNKLNTIFMVYRLIASVYKTVVDTKKQSWVCGFFKLKSFLVKNLI
jgi:hypothetical protein